MTHSRQRRRHRCATTPAAWGSTLRHVHPVVEIRQPNYPPLFVSVRGPLEIGRECRGLLLADPQASRRHLLIDVSGDAVTVNDLGSTNGSTIDGVPIAAPTVLAPGKVVRCGETTIRLDTAVQASPAPGGLANRTVVAQPDNGPQRPAMIDDEMRRTSIGAVAASVQDDGVDLSSLPADQGTLTIVFSDIESSTERALAVGDVRWMEILGHHNDLIKAHVAAHRGRVVKNQGDGYLLCFPSARQALLCSIGVQRDLDRLEREHPELAVRIRIGMHTGEVLLDDEGDLFGRHVLIAARVGSAADGGEILVSSLVRQIAEPRGDLLFGTPADLELKGIDEITTVHTVDWRASPVAASTSP